MTSNTREWFDSELQRVRKERDEARAECAALWGALEELRWPDLPGIPYVVFEPHLGGLDSPSPAQVQYREIPASEVQGIFRAIWKHARTMLPFGVAAVESHYAIDGLRHRIRELESARVEAP